MAIFNGDSSNNTLTGTATADSLYGYAGNDTLIGSDGNDYLDGGTGNDSMVGGLGNDVYVIDSATDVVVETAGQGTDVANVYTTTVNLSAASIEIVYMYSGSVNVTANTEDNKIYGNSANNSIDGGAGADTISSGAGNDTLTGGAGNDVLYGGDGDDVITGDTEDDRIYGGNGNDTISGGTGDDVISGGVGTDSMVGGAGNDVYFVDASTDVVVENLSEGTDKINSEVSLTLGANVENLQLLGSGNLNGTGNTLNNTLIGNAGNNSFIGDAGNDILIGGVGQDTMTGGAGNDTYSVDNSLDVVTELLGEGTDSVNSSISYVLGNNLENLTLTGTANLTGTGNTLNNSIKGNDGNNTLQGGAGNDVINGGAGNDSLVGGTGNDQYYVDSFGDVVVEGANEGNDRVYTYVAFTLPVNVENLVLLGSDSVSANGNSLVNNIRGNDGNNTLDGGAGADVLQGGGGNDVYYVDNVSDSVTENAGEGTDDVIYSSVNYTLPVNVERLIISGNATTLTGNSDANSLIGNSLANTISGGLGNDTLDGGTGADSLNGGDGNDVYYVDNAGDSIADSSGTDTIYSSITFDLSTVTAVENLVLTGSSSINGTGNASANVITGNSSTNILTSGTAGGSSGDTLVGGDGDDTYNIDDAGDIVTELDGEGTDIVQAYYSGYTLAVNVENLTLMGTNVAGTGNALDNTINGNASANSISGLDGNDRINGLAGNDTIQGGEGDDIIDGGADIDSMVGGNGNDTYTVDNASDVVVEGVGGGTDIVTSSVNYTLSANFEGLTLTGTATSGAGSTTTAANETITGNANANTLAGNDGDDTLYGGGANDTLNGGNGNDVMDGGTGVDSMNGGAGNDSYYIDDAADVVVDSAGTDTIYSALSFNLTSVTGIENLTLVGSQNITATGTAGNNYIVGNNSSNTLTGGGGTDTLEGGGGNDVYIMGGTLTIIETSTGGFDYLESSTSISLTSYSNIEGIRMTGAATATGDAGNNTLISTTWNATLNGGDGSDYLDSSDGASWNGASPAVAGEMGNDADVGGAYDQQYRYDDLLQGGNGDDTYYVSTWDEGDYRSGADDRPENAPYINDRIVDTGGNDTLIINWYDWDDDEDWPFLVEDGPDGIEQVILDLGANYNVPGTPGLGGNPYIAANTIENVTFLNSNGMDANKHVTGNASANRLTGGTSWSTLSGGAGNDTLDGGGGNDTLIGGADNDTYIYHTGDTITEAASGGTDTVISSASIALAAELEILYLQGSADLNGTGNTVANTLYGNAGNNILDGLGGADTMYGGAGDDTYDVNNAGDVTTENASSGSDTVSVSAGLTAGTTWTLSSNIENLYLENGSGAINGMGNALDNTINGWDNTAANVLSGKDGDDVYYVRVDVGTPANTDTVVEAANEGNDSVYIIATATLANYTLAANVENIVLQGTATFTNVTGNSSGNGMWGSLNTTANNLLGGLGDDYYVVGNNDTVTESASQGYDTVLIDNTNYTGALLNVEAVYAFRSDTNAYDFSAGRTLNFASNTTGLFIYSGSQSDNITGGSGADTLYGNGGVDTLIGGGGNDIYYITVANATVTEAAGAGTDLVYSAATYTLASNVENLTLSESGGAINGTGNSDANTVTGNTSNNYLFGADGNDTMVGGGGTDTLNGGRGNDVYYADSSSDNVTEVQNDLTDLLLAGSFAITGGSTPVGQEAPKAFDNNNGVVGNASKYLNLSGANTGVLIDLGQAALVTSLGLTTAEDASHRDPTSYTLYGSNTSTTVGMTLIGNGALTAPAGRSTDYPLINFASNTTNYRYYRLEFNSIRGGGGDTYMQIAEIRLGGAWNDTDTVNSSASFTLPTYIENLVLTGSSSIDGTGNAAANNITGNAANNTLNGLGGADTMAGGAGNDIYVVDNAGDSVSENASEGTDEVQASLSYTLTSDVENLTLTGSSNINATGNTLANTLIGNSGINVLTGGAGDDVYYVDSTDSVVETAGQGTDTVIASASYTLGAGANVENLQLLESAGAASAIGNEYDNFIQGNASNNTITGGLGDDTLDGMLGSDSLTGGDGNDVYFVDNTSDSVTELANQGEDTVYSQATTYILGSNVENLVLVGLNGISGTGNTQDNVITGNAGANVISGGGGNDVYNGMQGNDTITGGTGNSSYLFARGDGADSVTDTGGVDSLSYDSSVSHTQLWFAQSSNDLVITVIGTTDQITFAGWFTSTANHVESISAGDGFTLDESRVATLVSAMAALTQPPLGYTDLPPEYADSLELTLFSTWQG